jgi:hypothetical protein
MSKRETTPTPCGGCGATSERERCLGCLHDFGTPESAWVRRHNPPQQQTTLTDEQRNVVKRMLPREHYALSSLQWQGVKLETMEALASAGLVSPLGYWHLTAEGRELRNDILAAEDMARDG